MQAWIATRQESRWWQTLTHWVRYADDWLAGVCGTKAECEDLKAEIAEFLSTELKLTLSEEKTMITHSSEKVRFIGYDICVASQPSLDDIMIKFHTAAIAIPVPYSVQEWNACPLPDFVTHHDSVCFLIRTPHWLSCHLP